jgi:DNA-binding protein HU-beta
VGGRSRRGRATAGARESQGKSRYRIAKDARNSQKSRIFGVVHADSPQNAGLSAKCTWSTGARIAYVIGNSRVVRESHRRDPMAKAASPTVTLKHLAASLAAEHDMAKKQSQTILSDFIGGLSILQVRRSAARMGRNPATGEPMKIKAGRTVAFRAAKELKEAV